MTPEKAIELLKGLLNPTHATLSQDEKTAILMGVTALEAKPPSQE